MHTTAAVLRAGTGPYTIETVELREPGPGEVLVRVVGAGMCHTDVLPRGGRGMPLPIITGHEGSGVVETVGEGVENLAPGDHVVLTFDSCGDCPECERGTPAYCTTFLPRNLSGRALDGSTAATDADGVEVSSRWFGQSSFAHHALVTERNAVKVDPSLPLEKLGPLGCGVQTGAGSILSAMAVRSGSSIVVFGAGAVGLSAVMAAVVAGATAIVAVDLQEHRRDLALELGATHALDGAADDLADQLAALVANGYDYAFDTTGVPAVITTAIGILRLGGTAGLVGVQTGPLTIDQGSATGKTIMNILEGDVDPHVFIPRMIDMWQAGTFPFDRMIETFPLAEINEAEASSLAGGVIKPVLLP